MRLKGKTPEKFSEAPELRDEGLEFYLEAFNDLDTERSHGMGWTLIPWHAIIRYAQFYELNEDQTDRLVLYTQALDTANIERLEAKRKQNKDA